MSSDNIDTSLIEEVVLYSLLFPYVVSYRIIRQRCILAYGAPSRRAHVLSPPMARFGIVAECPLNLFVLWRIAQVLFESLFQAFICPFRRGACDVMGFPNNPNHLLVEGDLLLVTFDRGACNGLYRFPGRQSALDTQKICMAGVPSAVMNCPRCSARETVALFTPSSFAAWRIVKYSLPALSQNDPSCLESDESRTRARDIGP